MKQLIEISKIVTKKKVKKIEIFDEYSLRHRKSKFNEFYEGLMDDKFKGDIDAADYLYGCRPTDDKYRQLKSRFRKRLLNTVFFLDVNLPSASNYDRAYFSCNKDWTLVKILQSKGAHVTAAALARQIYTVALRYSLADVIVNCARILREYSVQEGDEKAYDEYDDMVVRYQKVLDAELESEQLYQRTLLSYYKPRDKSHDFEHRLDEYCQRLRSMEERFPESPVVFYNTYLVHVYRFEMSRDYQSMLAICDHAENYIESRPKSYQKEKSYVFQLKKMSAYLHMGDYSNGRANAEKVLATFKEGSSDWFEFMEYYFLLAMHTDNYTSAIAIFNRAIASNKYKKLPEETRFKWETFEVYLNFIVEHLSARQPILRRQMRRPFKLTRFLNDPVLFDKNQRIFTVLHVIAQVLFLIDRRQYNLASERIDRLRSYSGRQLKKEQYYRVLQFIKMLQQFEKADFRPEYVGKGGRYHENLLENPLSYRGLITEIEVLPFEKIWNILTQKSASMAA